MTEKAVKHRLGRGRLHPVHRGVYAVGRPELSRRGEWMAAVLACGSPAHLSHTSAAALWGITPDRGDLHVTVPRARPVRRAAITVHRRDLAGHEQSRAHGIPVTSPTSTLVDLAASISLSQLESAVNQADKLDLIHADEIRALLARFSRRPGLGTLKRLLDSRTFRLTDSELERRFLPLARAAGLPLPRTGARVSGYKVDFFWPHLGLVVETDGLRYHRTPAQQAADRRRDQAHAARGLTCLRFTHGQVVFEPERVRATLAAVAGRGRASPSAAQS